MVYLALILSLLFTASALREDTLKGFQPKWETSGPVEYISGGKYFLALNGVHAIRLGHEASISQKIHVKKGTVYALTFAASRSCVQEEVLRVSVPPALGDIHMKSLYSTNGSDVYAWAFRATSDFAKVTLHNPGMQEDPACGPLINTVAIKELLPPLLTTNNLVKNSGFEEGPHHHLIYASDGIILPPKQEDLESPLPGWIIESLKAVKYIDRAHFHVPSGQAAIELVAGRESAIAQIIPTVPKKKYTLTFSVGDAGNGCLGDMMVEAYAGKHAFKVPFTSAGKGNFKTVSFQFIAFGIRTRLTFFSSFYHTRVDKSGGLCGPIIDEVQVPPVA